RLIVNSAKHVAERMHSIGWCFSGVATALDRIGVHLHGKSAYMAKDQLLCDSRFTPVSINNLKPGDILVHGRNGNHKNGHIAVYLGNGMEASDHIQHLIAGNGYGGTTVFRYTGKPDSYA